VIIVNIPIRFENSGSYINGVINRREKTEKFKQDQYK